MIFVVVDHLEIKRLITHLCSKSEIHFLQDLLGKKLGGPQHCGATACLLVRNVYK